MFEVSADFASACRDYRFLLDSGYPEKASGKLVSDRYRLATEERIVMFRGVAPSTDSAMRMKALIGRRDVSGAGISRFTLLVDGYNVLYTILHFLIGKPLFISTDGFLRDAGASYGRLVHPELFQRSIDMLFLVISQLKPARVDFVLDAPVGGSGELAQNLRERLTNAEIDGSAETARSADFELKKKFRDQSDGAFVCSSDSAIVDAVARLRPEKPHGFDLARLILEQRYATSFIDLAVIVARTGPLAGSPPGQDQSQSSAR